MAVMNKQHTFVICAYKESPFLEECIKSLLMQSMQSKVIMITSTSNEYIKETAQKHQIPLYINNGDKGIAQDWNFGLQCANTKYVTLAHQDDIYLPDYCKYIMKEMEAQERPLIGFCDYYELRNGKMVKKNKLLRIKRMLLFPLRVKKLWSSVFVRRRILSLGSAICCPSVTMNKTNLPHPLFQTGLKSNVDWQAWEAISKRQGQFVYCRRALMAHRIHEDSETSAIIGESKRTKEDYTMFRLFWPAPIAKFLTKIYAGSEKSNQLKEK